MREKRWGFGPGCDCDCDMCGMRVGGELGGELGGDGSRRSYGCGGGGEGWTECSVDGIGIGIMVTFGYIGVHWMRRLYGAKVILYHKYLPYLRYDTWMDATVTRGSRHSSGTVWSARGNI